MKRCHLDVLSAALPMSEQGSKGGGGGVLFLEGLSTTLWHRPEWQDKCCTEHSPHSLGAGIPQCKQTHTPPPIVIPCPSTSLFASLWRLTHSVCGRVDTSLCACGFRCECGPWSWTSAQHREGGRQRAGRSSLEGALTAEHGAEALRAPC